MGIDFGRVSWFSWRVFWASWFVVLGVLFVPVDPASAEIVNSPGMRMCHVDTDGQTYFFGRDSAGHGEVQCNKFSYKGEQAQNLPTLEVENAEYHPTNDGDDVDLSVCENFTYHLTGENHNVCPELGDPFQADDDQTIAESSNRIHSVNELHRKLPRGLRVQVLQGGMRASTTWHGLRGSLNCSVGPQVQWIDPNGNTQQGMVWPEHCAYRHGAPVTSVYETNGLHHSYIGEVIYRDFTKDLAIVKYTNQDVILNPSARLQTNTFTRTFAPVWKTVYSEWNTTGPRFEIDSTMCYTGAVTDVKCGGLGEKSLQTLATVPLNVRKITHDGDCGRSRPGDSGAPVWQPSLTGHLRLAGMLHGLAPPTENGSCLEVFTDWADIQAWGDSKFGANSDFHYIYDGANS